MVTLKTFALSHQANMIKTLLEAEGIECYLQDEFTLNSDPLLTNAIGGIKLQVQPQDSTRALDILTERGYMDEEYHKDSHQKIVDYLSEHPKIIWQIVLGAIIGIIVIGFVKYYL